MVTIIVRVGVRVWDRVGIRVDRLRVMVVSVKIRDKNKDKDM
jgi:hypothetical protein